MLVTVQIWIWFELLWIQCNMDAKSQSKPRSLHVGGATWKSCSTQKCFHWWKSPLFSPCWHRWPPCIDNVLFPWKRNCFHWWSPRLPRQSWQQPSPCFKYVPVHKFPHPAFLNYLLLLLCAPSKKDSSPPPPSTSSLLPNDFEAEEGPPCWQTSHPRGPTWKEEGEPCSAKIVSWIVSSSNVIILTLMWSYVERHQAANTQEWNLDHVDNKFGLSSGSKCSGAKEDGRCERSLPQAKKFDFYLDACPESSPSYSLSITNNQAERRFASTRAVYLKEADYWTGWNSQLRIFQYMSPIICRIIFQAMNYIQGLAACLPPTTSFPSSFNNSFTISNSMTSTSTSCPLIFNDPEPEESEAFVVFQQLL